MYFNKTTDKWYIEGHSITVRIEGGVFSGIPNKEQLTSWGFEEYVEPQDENNNYIEDNN